MSSIGILEGLDIVMNGNYTLKSKLGCLWLIYQTITFLPMLWCFIVRFYKQIRNEDYYDMNKEFPTYKIDLMVKIYAFGYVAFYAVDMILIFPEVYKICKMSYMLHHLVTLYGAWNFFNMTYFPWFILAPLAFHSILIMYPELTFLNYFYLATILACYYACMQKPYHGRRNYEKVKTYIIMLTFPLVGLWFFNCTNHINLE